ncbi:TPR repeat-containing protein [Calothrix sp. NIES-4071]|nr:TPR repeat-containing protein [Calothrix sp. NIES-4071]BAZ54493.1 TPR repeat-containing protein [Calothrix sp. NIES-4105]
MCKSKQWYLSIISILIITLTLVKSQNAAKAEIIPAKNDTNTIVNPDSKDNSEINITGGASAGGNLFHSFEKFGIDEGQTANFISNPLIQNILMRVKGGEASVINGTLQVTGGNSNLYFMNPAGIVFGSGASLNVPGAFIATTANGIGFGNQWFNATGVNDYTYLVGEPSQFGFTMSQPGAIANNAVLSSSGNIVLIGGTVLNTGAISSWGGQVVVATVPGERVVRISQPGQILSLEVEPLSTQPNLPNNWSIPIVSLPQLLTGGNVTDASGVTITKDKVVLTGSGIEVKEGDIATTSIYGQNVTLAAGNQITIEEAIFTANLSGVIESLPDIILVPEIIGQDPGISSPPPPGVKNTVNTVTPPVLGVININTNIDTVTPPVLEATNSITPPVVSGTANLTNPSVVASQNSSRSPAQTQNVSNNTTVKPNEFKVSSLPSISLLQLIKQPSTELPTDSNVKIVQEDNYRKIATNRLFDQGIQYYRNNQFTNARSNWEKALSIYRENRDTSGEGATLGALGGVHLYLNDYKKAAEYSSKFLSLARKEGNLKSQAQALVNLGIAHKVLGQYSEALGDYKEALSIATKISAVEIQVQVLGNLGNAYEILGDYDSAVDTYQQSLKLARQLKMSTAEAIILGNLGAVYANLANYNKAITSYEQSLQISKNLNERSIQASTLINLGSIYHTMNSVSNHIDKARIHYEQALQIAITTGDKRREAEALASLGLVYKDFSDYPKAIKYQEQSVAIAKELKDPVIKGLTLNNLGHTLYSAGKFSDAEQKLRNAIQIYDSLRPGLNDSYKVSIFDTQAFTYSLLQQILIAAKKPTSALEASEQSRARAFKELLANRVNENNKSLASTNTAVESANSSINIDRIRKIAREQNATLVEYSIVRDNDFKARGKQQGREQDLFIWVVKPTGEVSFRQVDLKPFWNKEATLTSAIEISRCLIVDPFADCGKQMQAIRSLKHHISTSTSAKSTKSQDYRQILHQYLIEPIADLLPNNPVENVIFIPQGSLFLVPFAALQDKDGNYLIEKHTIRTAPSIQVLDLTSTLRIKRQSENSLSKNSSKSSLIVGNPIMPKISLEPGQPLQKLPQLPYSQQESLDIAKILNTTAITGAEATKSNIISKMASSRFVHLATHGLLEYGTSNGRVSLQGLGIPGAIALAPSNTDDGLLTANEIINLRLNAELVVLSACRTGEGRISGDGVIGLSRSFISAGVESVIVSLWNVRDVQTAKLMKSFYQALDKNPNKASALRQAMLTTMKQDTEPLYWAGFTLIGE